MSSEINPAIKTICYFHEWSFDPSDGQLRSKQKVIRLPPRLSKLLAVFLANIDTVLTREQLIDILWQDKSVNEDALSRCIAELRATIGDNRNTPVFIQTVPKKGYRFIQSLKVSKSRQFRNSGIVIILILIASLFIKNLITQNNDIGSIQTALLSSKRLTTDTVNEIQPELSSHGDMVAFSVVDNNRMIVKVINIDGDSLYNIKDPEYHLYSPAFSPDDKFLLIAGSKDKQCSILKYQIPSLEKTNLGTCSLPNISGIFDWSFDGKKIAYVSSDKSSTNSGIWFYDLISNKHNKLTSSKISNIFDSRPRFSPDGRHIAFTRGNHSARELFLIDLDNPKQELQLTNGKNIIASFSWLKDNKHLIFDSDELGERNLWLINIENKKKVLLGARDAQFPSMNQDNSILAYQEVRYNANIWNVNLETQSAEPNKIISSIKYNNHPTFSPDGQLIAFASNRQGLSEIWLYSLSTKQQTRLLSLPKLNLFMPHWSDDGSHIIVSSRGKNGYRCYEIEVKSGSYHPIRSIKDAHFSCEYGNNGAIYAVTKTPEQPTKLIKLTPEGNLENLITDSVRRIQKSGIGTLIYSLVNQQGLYSIGLDGKGNRIILNDFKHSLDDHWTVQGHYLYFPRLDNKKGIWRIDLTNGKEEFMTPHLPSAIGLTMSVNPDHSRLLISRTDNRQIDIYLTRIQSAN